MAVASMVSTLKKDFAVYKRHHLSIVTNPSANKISRIPLNLDENIIHGTEQVIMHSTFLERCFW